MSLTMPAATLAVWVTVVWVAAVVLAAAVVMAAPVAVAAVTVLARALARVVTAVDGGKGRQSFHCLTKWPNNAVMHLYSTQFY